MQQKVQPALLGGLFMGVLSALPIIGAGNCCCCLWVIGGGVVAAYLLQQSQQAPLTPGDGAIVGLMAGLFGAVVDGVISVPVHLMTGGLNARFMQRLIERMPNVDPSLRQMIENSQNPAAAGVGMIVGLFIGFAVMLVAGLIFGSLGGMLGALFFKKNQPPAPPAPPSPPAGFPPPFNPPPLQQ